MLKPNLIAINQFVLVLISFAVIILIFLICREIVCWYLKINKRNEILEEQNELLKSQNDILKSIYSELKNDRNNS